MVLVVTVLIIPFPVQICSRKWISAADSASLERLIPPPSTKLPTVVPSSAVSVGAGSQATFLFLRSCVQNVGASTVGRAKRQDIESLGKAVVGLCR